MIAFSNPGWRHDREHHGSAAGYDRAVPPPGTSGMPPLMQGVLYRLWAELDGHEAVEALVDASGLDIETGKAVAM